MAKRQLSENSLKNLEKGKPFVKGNEELAREAQLKSAKKRAENRALDNTIERICRRFMDSSSSKEAQQAFAQIGFDVDTKLANLIAQVVTQGLSSKASIKDKLALLEFLGRYTGQEPAQKIEVEDKPVINIDIPR